MVDLQTMRHSAAHVMAQAVLERFPGGKIGIGPAVADGFYYDFELPRSVTSDDLAAIEARMVEIIRANVPFVREEISAEAGRKLFADQPYKLELIDLISRGEASDHGDAVAGAPPASEVLSIYRSDTFVDLCRGPHVARTGEIGPVKLLSVAGAYWRGDEKNPMLQRIYGTAWHTQEELEQYLWRIEEAKRRDHRKVGKDLGLFMASDLVGPGLPLWLPKGATVRRILENFIVEEEIKRGYQHVYTPHLAKVELYKTSGHWAHYKDSMFPVMKLEGEELVLRPMNCPHHIQIYANEMRSYRDLPIKIAELGTMYRYEKSGELSGLSRVRAMTLNDAHIFCRPDQIKQEFIGVVRLIEDAYQALGFTDYWYRLSLRDPKDKVKFVQNDEMWNLAEAMLRDAVRELGLEVQEAPGEASFYGPKLDVQVSDVLGHDETISTVQIDFHLPNQFKLEYIGEDNQPHMPVMIHRGVISTMERMMAFLIERYVGAFPLWLAPVQVVVIPIADRHNEYANRVAERLRAAGLRVEVDSSNERMQAKIRNAQLQKVNYMLVVGDKEAASDAVAVRSRDQGDLGPRPFAEFLAMALDEVARKA